MWSLRPVRRAIGVAWLLAAPAVGHAQDLPGRLLLEAGIDGGDGACPGHYVGIKGRIAGPVSLYGSIDNYRCLEATGASNRFGTSIRLGRLQWLVRPAVRTGLEYESGDLSSSVGGSLTFGRRWGARFIVDKQIRSGGGILLLQVGGYLSF